MQRKFYPQLGNCICIHNVYTTSMTTKTTTLNVRTDAATKHKAQRVFKRMGLDLSTGVNMYLFRVAQDKAMPFTPRTINGFTPKFEAETLREVAHAEKYGESYTADEIMQKFFR